MVTQALGHLSVVLEEEAEASFGEEVGVEEKEEEEITRVMYNVLTIKSLAISKLTIGPRTSR